MIPGFRFGFYSKSYPSQNQHLFKSHQIKVLNNYYSETPPNILRYISLYNPIDTNSNMKKLFSKAKSTKIIFLMSFVVTAFIFNSCADDFLETNKPEWLGESIYDQLEQGYTDENGTEHTFKTYLRLINDIEYQEVLQRTGSKTLFVSDDAAFERFYKSNAWGVTKYEDFTMSQKKLIMNSSMINNAYLIELMSSTEGPVKGQALRRNTAYSALDSITYETAESMPDN